MSAAKDKNAQALKALFGNGALVERLSSTNIAMVLPQEELSASGRLLAAVLSDVLARLWPCISFHGAEADRILTVAQSAAQSGGGNGSGLQVRWAPPYDIVVAVGCDAPPDAGYTLRIGADGWHSAIGADAKCGNSLNPVGPAFAGAMAGAQVFHRVFQSELAGMATEPFDSWHVDVRQLFAAAELEVANLDLGETHAFGVGAVTHGLMWMIEHWPAQVSGALSLVDQDKYGSSNGQRYAFMRPGDTGQMKVAAIKNRLETAHPQLTITDHPTDLNSYCANRGFDRPLHRVIAGLDSAEARRHVALKLPERTVNMWTAGERTGAGRYLPAHGGACLACDYLEKVDTQLDEVAELFQQTSIRPDIIRSLLDSGRGLSVEEAATIASRWGTPADKFVGQPLRSVMPALCATGRLQMPNNPEVVDVPFAFASLFAGISGFMMLLKDLKGDDPSEGWTQHIFKRPTPLLLRALHTRSECVCCSTLSDLATET